MCMKILKSMFLTFLALLLLWLGLSSVEASACRYSEGQEITSFLDGCKPKTLVWKTGNYEIAQSGMFKDTVNNWLKNISVVLWILAVSSYVYAWFLMQIAAGSDEDVEKAKNIIKWTSVWFIGMISAGGIIYIVINLMYSIW